MLVREHVFNTVPHAIACFLDRHVPDEIETLPEAMGILDAERRRELEELLKQGIALADLGDPIEIVRCWQQTCILSKDEFALPHLGEISFADATSFRQKAEQFLKDEPRRREVSREQCRYIEQRLTYRAALGRAIGRIRHLLASEGVS